MVSNVLNEAQRAAVAKAYNAFTGAGGSMLIDGQVPVDADAVSLAFEGLDDIDIVTLISDLQTFKIMMEANALGNQAGAAYNSKAILHLNTSNYARTGVTWTK
jgi:hypothetical protein